MSTDESQIASGKLFQVRGRWRGPVTANDPSPNEVRVRGTWSFPLTADLIIDVDRRLDDSTLPGTPEYGH